MKPVYYNEWDGYCAEWLRNLITAGHLPAGEVDERDIKEVQPDDLKGFGVCHFFAGVGGWPYAGRLAGLDDGAEWWSGSMKEAQLHRAVAAYLDYALPAGSWWRSIANESPAGVGWRRKLHGHGVRAGTPDILICSGGIPIFIELKSEKGQQTKAQRDTFANLMAQGLDCTIARSVAEVQAYLEFCGVPLRAKVAA